MISDRALKIVAALPFAVVLACYHFIHRANSAELGELRTTLRALESANAAALAVGPSGGVELERKLSVLQRHMVRLEELIPRREEVADLLHTITQRAQSTGVELLRMKPEREEAAAHYSRQTYQITVKGTVQHIGQYLTEVGSLPRIITPIELTLQSTPGETDRRGSPLLGANFRIVTYLVPDPVTQAVAEASSGTIAVPVSTVGTHATLLGDPKLIFEREVFTYPAENRRDPFRPPINDGSGPVFEDLELRMIIYSVAASQSLALAADGSNKTYRLRRGQSLGNATVLDIEPARVFFMVEDYGNRRRAILELPRNRKKKEPGQ